jgi:hypothetical protein
MTPNYMARNDFNNEGCNCNPYALASVDWCDYELEFQRIWAESQGINYGI